MDDKEAGQQQPVAGPHDEKDDMSCCNDSSTTEQRPSNSSDPGWIQELLSFDLRKGGSVRAKNTLMALLDSNLTIGSGSISIVRINQNLREISDALKRDLGEVTKDNIRSFLHSKDEVVTLFNTFFALKAKEEAAAAGAQLPGTKDPVLHE